MNYPIRRHQSTQKITSMCPDDFKTRRIAFLEDFTQQFRGYWFSLSHFCISFVEPRCWMPKSQKKKEQSQAEVQLVPAANPEKSEQKIDVKRLALQEARRVAKKKRREKRKVCFGCRGTGHSMAECPNVQPDSEQKAVVYCYNCGSTKHQYKACPSERIGGA